jgi:hypothetical protein
MRDQGLRDALRAFALESAAFLTEELENGAELAFDLEDQSSRRGPALYRYRPLTEEFIEARWLRLRGLPAYHPAALALGAGAARLVRAHGLRGGEDAEPALKAMLERLYEDATSFRFPEERFERVMADVEQTLEQGLAPAMIVAALPGVALDAEALELGGGLSIEHGPDVEAPPEAAWAEDGETSRAVVVLRFELDDGDELPVTEARDRFRGLVEGLRLYRAGAVTLPGIGFAREAEGRWQPLELEGAGAARGEPMLLTEDDEAALPGFLEAVERSPRRPQVAWAIRRFDMGCSRRLEAEALTDHLLALRALLDVDGQSLPLRLAALCAQEGERKGLQRRLERAVELERALMGGDRDPRLRSGESPRALASELEVHVRALLRDVLCGYLDPDLGAVADDILLEVPEPAPGELSARDLRVTQETNEMDALDPALFEDEEPDPSSEDDFPDGEEDFADGGDDSPEGVTPSADWQDYSAPV